jgi:hypothetical protein
MRRPRHIQGCRAIGREEEEEEEDEEEEEKKKREREWGYEGIIHTTGQS